MTQYTPSPDRSNSRREPNPRKSPVRAPDESTTGFTLRLMLSTVWWEGHDSACDLAPGCKHSGPYDTYRP